MFSKLIRSKTFWGSLLGVISLILLAAPEYAPGIPEKVVKIFAMVSLAIVTFGLTDAANMELASLIEKIKGFIATKAGVGAIVSLLNALIDGIPQLGFLPEGVVTILYIFGAFLVSLGLREKVVQARLDNSTIPVTLQSKYQK